MVNITFLDPNVFNVLKYIVLAATLSLAADLLLDTMHEFTTAKTLLGRGWIVPAGSRSPRFRFRRGMRLRNAFLGISLFAAVIAVSVLEMAVEFSTGAQSIWITSTETFRISNQASDMEELRRNSADYVHKMRVALQRVERTCYNIDERWYSPVSFNLTNSTEFQGLGSAAWCLRNYTERIDVTETMAKSSFLAADVAATNIWNHSVLRVGRDVEMTEMTDPYLEMDGVRIGTLEKYSFLAVNFSKKDAMIEGSERAVTGGSLKQEPFAYWTANFSVESGRMFECLVRFKWVLDKETGQLTRKPPNVEVCLIPISGDRMVLGLFDDVATTNEFQLVMSVALKGVRSFHELHVLRMLPWMVGRNSGMHTYRELGTLAVICGEMITGISVDGLREVSVDVGVENVTVPTWSVWGMILLGIGLFVILCLKIMVSRMRRRLKIRANLGSANGVAESWLSEREELDEVSSKSGRPLLVVDC